MSRRTFACVLTAILAVGLFMRVAWLRADPPVADAVGIVWHDEGAWVHNARNRALWGVWRTDAWNPVFVAPVFTALEYASFEAFGVGLWQARVVPLVSGLAAIAALVIGLRAIAGREAAAIGAGLLATTYAFVMWNRAALMESTMTAAMVVAWAAYARGSRDARWGAMAGVAATGAWFTKAAAAFFVAALALDAGLTILRGWRSPAADRRNEARLAWWTLAGLAIAFAITAALLVAAGICVFKPSARGKTSVVLALGLLSLGAPDMPLPALWLVVAALLSPKQIPPVIDEGPATDASTRLTAASDHGAESEKGARVVGRPT